MRLKVRKHLDLVRPLTIRGTFEVDVRAQTRASIEQLLDSCSVPKLNPQTGRVEPTLNDDTWAERAPDHYIAGWRGLTPSVIQELGVALEDDMPTDADGLVPYDAELARDLWRRAFADKFSLPVMNFGRDLLALVEAEKKISSNGSGG